MAEPLREAVRIVIERMRNDPDSFLDDSGSFSWLRKKMYFGADFWYAFTSDEATALKEELKALAYREFNKRVLATVFQEDRCEDSND